MSPRTSLTGIYFQCITLQPELRSNGPLPAKKESDTAHNEPLTAIWPSLYRIVAIPQEGRLLRAVTKSGKVKESMSGWAVWSVVEQSAKEIGIERFGAHDLRRTCAKLCRKNGGNIEQIKFLLGHSSIQTTERSLGSEQEIEIAVNDNLGL